MAEIDTYGQCVWGIGFGQWRALVLHRQARIGFGGWMFGRCLGYGRFWTCVVGGRNGCTDCAGFYWSYYFEQHVCRNKVGCFRACFELWTPTCHIGGRAFCSGNAEWLRMWVYGRGFGTFHYLLLLCESCKFRRYEYGFCLTFCNDTCVATTVCSYESEDGS